MNTGNFISWVSYGQWGNENASTNAAKIPRHMETQKVNVHMRRYSSLKVYSNFRNYAPPLDVKGGIIAEKVVPVFSESSFLACFGLVM